MVKAVIKNNCLPPGSYECTFEGVEEVTHEKYGAGWKWVFEVIKGPHEGQQCVRTTKPEPTPKNSCGKFLAALAGKPPAADLEIDTDDFVGQTYSVMVSPSQDGDATRVETFVPMDSGDTPL